MKKEVNQDKIVRDHVVWSLAGGVVPVPVLDMAAVTVVQLDMIKELCRFYDQNYSKFQANAWISSLAGSTLPKIAASALKLIPGVGTAFGIVSMSILSGATTFAIGQVLIKHFEEGGTVYDFDPKQYKDIFKIKLDEGKEVAREYKEKFAEKIKKVSKSQKLRAIDKIKELQELKEKGVLTEEEFNSIKAKIVKDFLIDTKEEEEEGEVENEKEDKTDEKEDKAE